MACRPREEIDYHFAIRQIEQLMSGPSGRTSVEEEDQILSILNSAGKGGLNLIIQTVDVTKLFGDTTGSIFSTRRSKLLRLVSKKRINDLDLKSKKALIVAMRLRIASHSGEEAAIVAMFRNTEGKKLVELKDLVDEDEDTNMPMLVFHDIKDGGLRNKLIRHFQKQADRIKKANVRPKIFATIENTVLATGENSKYVNGLAIPGALSFIREVSPKVVLASVSPVLNPLLNEYIYHLFHKFDLVRPTILASDLPHEFRTAFEAPKSLKQYPGAEEQYINIMLYGKIFPECRLVILLNNSREGLDVGRELVTNMPAMIRSVFVHDAGADRPITSTADRPKLYRDAATFVFDSYVEVAAEAFEDGLITATQMARISASAVFELSLAIMERGNVSRDKDHKRQGKQLLEAFRRDLDLVNSKLPSENNLVFDVLLDPEFSRKAKREERKQNTMQQHFHMFSTTSKRDVSGSPFGPRGASSSSSSSSINNNGSSNNNSISISSRHHTSTPMSASRSLRNSKSGTPAPLARNNSFRHSPFLSFVDTYSDSQSGGRSSSGSDSSTASSSSASSSGSSDSSYSGSSGSSDSSASASSSSSDSKERIKRIGYQAQRGRKSSFSSRLGLSTPTMNPTDPPSPGFRPISGASNTASSSSLLGGLGPNATLNGNSGASTPPSKLGGISTKFTDSSTFLPSVSTPRGSVLNPANAPQAATTPGTPSVVGAQQNGDSHHTPSPLVLGQSGRKRDKKDKESKSKRKSSKSSSKKKKKKSKDRDSSTAPGAAAMMATSSSGKRKKKSKH